MKSQHLLVSATIISTQYPGDAFSASSSSRFLGSVPLLQSANVGSRHSCLSFPINLRMDCDHDSIDAQALSELERSISALMKASGNGMSHKRVIFSPGRSPMSPMTMEEASCSQGMPWTKTIGRTDVKDPLLYMPFWEWQFEFMQSALTNLHPIECSTTSEADVSYNENKEKRARIVNHCYASDEYRKIRMTYYDAGDSVQVFNSVWYPDAKYNLPILGIDLLSFNRKKYLAIVDFQPLHEDESNHCTMFEHILKPIKEKYDNLKGRMSSRFYDETQFFSKEMLFARFENGNIVYEDLFPAFKSYVSAHVELVQNAPSAMTQQEVQRVFERQRAYDTYSAERDPAAGLFAAMFGKEWAEDFIYDFLFSLSERKEGGLDLSPPMFGGGGSPPSSSGKGGNPHSVNNNPQAVKGVPQAGKPVNAPVMASK